MSYNAIHVRIHKPWSEHDGSTVGVWFNGDRVVFFKDSQRIAEAEGFSACKDPLYPYFFSTAALAQSVTVMAWMAFAWIALAKADM